MTFRDLAMKVGENYKKEKEFGASEREKFFEGREKRNIEYLEGLLNAGAGRGTVASCLAGYDSPAAWRMRRGIKAEAETLTKLNRAPIKNDLISGLAAIDSEPAWQWRAEFEADEDGDYNSLAKSLIGLDSPRAWELRNKIEKKLNDSGEESYFNSPTLVKNLFLSLIGVDSEPAWNLRERLRERGGAVQDYVLSLSGIDSPRAQAAREKSFQQTQLYSGFNVYNSLMKSSIGLKGEMIKEIKRQFIKTKGDPNYYLDSLAVDWSAKAADYRWQAFEAYHDSQDKKLKAQHLGLSIAGLTEAAANEPENEIRAALVRDGFLNEAAYSLHGDLETFYAVDKKLKNSLN